MNCPHCGQYISEDSKFCPECGAPIVQEVPVHDAEEVYQEAAHAAPVYGWQGCVAEALTDIRTSENWFGRLLILGLIDCVPIMNLLVPGYAYHWSKELSFGRRSPMPRHYFKGRKFELGFMAFIVSLVFALVGGLATAALWYIPVLGVLVAIAISLFLSMLSSVCCMRMAVLDQMGEGFNITRGWDAMQRNWTGLFCASILPPLVASLVASFVIAIVVGIIFGWMFSIASAVSGAAVINIPDLASMDTLAMVFFSAGGIVLFIILYIFSSMVCTAGEIIGIRAVGHWVARHAPEWRAEAIQQNAYYQGSPQSQP